MAFVSVRATVAVSCTNIREMTVSIVRLNAEVKPFVYLIKINLNIMDRNGAQEKCFNYFLKWDKMKLETLLKIYQTHKHPIKNTFVVSFVQKTFKLKCYLVYMRRIKGFTIIEDNLKTP